MSPLLTLQLIIRQASTAQPAEEEINADSRLSELCSVQLFTQRKGNCGSVGDEQATERETEDPLYYYKRLTQTVQETRATLSDVGSFFAYLNTLSILNLT